MILLFIHYVLSDLFSPVDLDKIANGDTNPPSKNEIKDAGLELQKEDLPGSNEGLNEKALCPKESPAGSNSIPAAKETSALADVDNAIDSHEGGLECHDGDRGGDLSVLNTSSGETPEKKTAGSSDLEINRVNVPNVAGSDSSRLPDGPIGPINPDQAGTKGDSTLGGMPPIDELTTIPGGANLLSGKKDKSDSNSIPLVLEVMLKKKDDGVKMEKDGENLSDSKSFVIQTTVNEKGDVDRVFKDLFDASDNENNRILHEAAKETGDKNSTVIKNLEEGIGGKVLDEYWKKVKVGNTLKEVLVRVIDSSSKDPVKADSNNGSGNSKKPSEDIEKGLDKKSTDNSDKDKDKNMKGKNTPVSFRNILRSITPGLSPMTEAELELDRISSEITELKKNRDKEIRDVRNRLKEVDDDENSKNKEEKAQETKKLESDIDKISKEYKLKLDKLIEEKKGIANRNVGTDKKAVENDERNKGSKGATTSDTVKPTDKLSSENIALVVKINEDINEAKRVNKKGVDSGEIQKFVDENNSIAEKAKTKFENMEKSIHDDDRLEKELASINSEVRKELTDLRNNIGDYIRKEKAGNLKDEYASKGEDAKKTDQDNKKSNDENPSGKNDSIFSRVLFGESDNSIHERSTDKEEKVDVKDGNTKEGVVKDKKGQNPISMLFSLGGSDGGGNEGAEFKKLVKKSDVEPGKSAYITAEITAKLDNDKKTDEKFDLYGFIKKR